MTDTLIRDQQRNETLAPAAELAAKASRPWPNEPAGYREAREALLAEEIELRRHIARVATQRRSSSSEETTSRRTPSLRPCMDLETCSRRATLAAVQVDGTMLP